MTVLIQQITTGLFYRTSNAWVEKLEEAANFRTSAEAIRCCVKLRLEKVRVVVFEGKSQKQIYVAPFGEAQRKQKK